jgi:predicted PurR-regulated permease PerM
LWALLVLISAVVQLPVALVMVPPVALAFSSLSPAAAGLFTVYCLAVALIDNFLKPILFGRGVQVPALVIFLGAIGGMISMGIVGLFLGAVVLALGYELFKAWLDDPSAAAEAARPEST